MKNVTEFKTTEELNALLTSESVELLESIHAVNDLSKHIRKVFEYVVYAASASEEDLPTEICTSLTLIIDLAELIKKLETPN